MTELKPCPFCASPNIVYPTGWYAPQRTICRDCGATGPIFTPVADDIGSRRDAEQKARTAWNTRKEPSND